MRWVLVLLLIGFGFLLLATTPALLSGPSVDEPPAPKPSFVVVDLRSHMMRDLSPTTLPQVSAGERKTCALNRAGQLYCWGAHSDVPSDLGPVRQVSVVRAVSGL
ncbi:RCC1 domain-containing protein [Candidatus Chloroploca sp. Khr17]|uniref:RCC1-like domain-containing protein n=1 Tax=Candidatus Chloroploca sp. Khr17 TaxID=2496869 RepID=UPI00101E072B|nr:RCC1 domain-containing protein [Candidatus Chloroploca sp. Khr17]